MAGVRFAQSATKCLTGLVVTTAMTASVLGLVTRFGAGVSVAEQSGQ
jgi:hypothetical protein